MNKLVTKFLVVLVMFSIVTSTVPMTVFAHSSSDEESYTYEESEYKEKGDFEGIKNEEKHEENDYENSNSYGCELSDLANYYSNGLITVNPIVVNQDLTHAYFLIKNKTNCNVPVSLSSYKMFDNVLSHQEFFDGTELVNATTSTLLEVKLPSCMAQIDAWYGKYPTTLLDSNPYGYPNVPFVLSFKFIRNSGTGYHDASGDFCEKEVVNTAPVITLKGLNPDVVYLGTSYIDPGATALDLEDGDITSQIVVTGSIDTTTLGTYTLYYNVKDSKGLSASQVKRKVNVVTKQEEVNNPPVITLVGNNPININQGDLFVDPGATALDLEDGDITSRIISSSTVNTLTPGSYFVTYNVKDSKGLEAFEVKRTVNVLEVVPNNPGKITFCLILADSQNNIATSSYLLPQGNFSIQLGTTTGDIASSTFFQSKVWNSNTFSPNKRAILGVNDSDCITYDNLPYGIYTYNELNINGSSWNKAIYNDQDTQPVNNIFDFFNYGTTTTNADGYIILGSERRERVLYVVSKYNENNQCVLPEINSSLNVSVNVNSSFIYTITASSTDTVSVSTTTLPAWLTFATSTNTLSGVPTQVGTYTVDLKATNSCGFDSKVLTISVNSNGGGGGGGGSSVSDLDVSKTVDKVTVNPGDTVTYTIQLINHGPNDATNVVVNDLLPNKLNFVSSTSTIGSYSTTTGVWLIGNLSNNATTTLTILATVASDASGLKITNTATANSALTDPTSGNNTSSVDINVNSAGCTSNCGGGGGGGGNGGGNGPISTVVPSNGPVVAPTTTPNSCYYLFDYLRKDFNNNPVEVKKLQVFLKELQGESNLQITGIYDDQTIQALNRFQNKYKDEILTPWGHTEPTSYTYILTKKKVNEIYCKMAFPVTSAQQSEIDAYRNFLQGLKDAGIDTSSTPNQGGQKEEESFINVGVNTIKDKMQLATLAGYSSSTQKIVSDMTANIISGAKKLLGYFSGLFTKDDNQCSTNKISYLNIILILIILTLIYMWYRERRNNIKIEEINKEIDLN